MDMNAKTIKVPFSERQLIAFLQSLGMIETMYIMLPARVLDIEYHYKGFWSWMIIDIPLARIKKKIEQ